MASALPVNALSGQCQGREAFAISGEESLQTARAANDPHSNKHPVLSLPCRHQLVWLFNSVLSPDFQMSPCRWVQRKKHSAVPQSCNLVCAGGPTEHHHFGKPSWNSCNFEGRVQESPLPLSPLRQHYRSIRIALATCRMSPVALQGVGSESQGRQAGTLDACHSGAACPCHPLTLSHGADHPSEKARRLTEAASPAGLSLNLS